MAERARHALPWGAFVASLWQDAIARGVAAPPFVVLDDDQAQVLWERAQGHEDAPLRDKRGAAALAASAWARFNAYADVGERVGALPARGDDQNAFVRWARRYERLRDRLPARDAAALAHALIAACASTPGSRIVPWCARASSTSRRSSASCSTRCAARAWMCAKRRGR